DRAHQQYTTPATDEAGIVSALSVTIKITVDTVSMVTPVISAVGGEETGGITGDNTPTIGGTGTTGDTVIIYNNGVEVVRVPVVNGEWSYTPGTIFADGPLNITVAAVDQAGNLSPLSPAFTVTVDTLPPTVPQVDSISDSTLSNGVLYTNDNTPVLTGK